MCTAVVAGTFDTKGDELAYLARLLAGAGVPVRTVDLGTSGRKSGADISASEVAARHPAGADAVLAPGDRGRAIRAMSDAFARYVEESRWIGGILGAGGSGGTALLAPAMRALPVGMPKVLVSTVASGNVAPYVGSSDIHMVYSVTDVQGLNRISRRVLGNAAHALAGMMRHPVPVDGTEERPIAGLTMFGVTTVCVSRLASSLQSNYEPLVFHATGTGGRSLERLVDSGMIEVVIDLTTTEIADLLVGGILPATQDRLGAIIRTCVPYVGSCGALDMVNFGPKETVPSRFRGRRFLEHNPQVTLMRTTTEENAQFGAWISDRLNRMQGPVRFLIPEGGVSAIDAPGQPFHDPEADAALFGAIEAGTRQTARRRVIRVPANLNTPAFADAARVALTEIAGG